MTDKAGNLLVCVYTCTAHEAFLEAFSISSVARFLGERPKTRIVPVYAEMGISQPEIAGGRLLVPAEETYEKLSLKTYEMIAAACELFQFDWLLKIDVSVVRRNFSDPEYADRKPIDLDDLLAYLQQAPNNGDYDGYTFMQSPSRDGALNWARKKGKAINYERIFGDGPMCSFYSGKCYFISRRLAEFIRREGEAIAREQAEHFLGSEDVMIGRLYEKFAAGHK